MTIRKGTKNDWATLIVIWERAVRATHHFLDDQDITYYQKMILEQYFDVLDLTVLQSGKQITGFTGVAKRKIEMLFIDPTHFRKGLGKTLLQHAIVAQGAVFVDVNEHNPAALKFYEANGFVTFQRHEKDGEGRDFPILRMKLNSYL